MLWIYLIIYFVILFGIVFAVRKKEDKEDFLISGRNRNSWQVLFSKFAGSVGVGWFVTYTAYAFEFGWTMFGLIIGAVIGYLFLAFVLVPRFYNDSRNHNLYTQGDLVELRTGHKFARQLNDWVSILIQFLWLPVTIVGGGKIISHFGLMSYDLAVILTAIIILAYILIGGFKAVVTTDVFQGVIVLVLLFFVSFEIIGDTSILDIVKTDADQASMLEAIGFALFGFFSYFAFADRYQLVFAARSEKVAKSGMSLALIPIFITSILLLIIGLFVRIYNPALDPGLVFIEALNVFLSPELLPIAVVLFFAGLMSTADTEVYTISSQYAFFKNNGKSIEETKKAAIVTVVLGLVVSLIFRDIVDLTVFAAMFSLILGLPMIIVAYRKKMNPHRFIGSIVGGMVGVLVAILVVGLVPTGLIFPLFGGLLGLLWMGKRRVV